MIFRCLATSRSSKRGDSNNASGQKSHKKPGPDRVANAGKFNRQRECPLVSNSNTTAHAQRQFGQPTFGDVQLFQGQNKYKTHFKRVYHIKKSDKGEKEIKKSSHFIYMTFF